MQRIIAGNWKMHGTGPEAAALLAGLSQSVNASVTTVICPPFTLLSDVGHTIEAWKNTFLGAQDCRAEEKGAFTGDISAPMLKDAGCAYVILGHSERRQYHGESDALIAGKFASVLAQGLKPILCVGETLEQREAGEAETVVERQLLAALPATVTGELIVAYEPVWAIGTGRTASSGDITEMHRHILRVLKEKKSLEKNRVAVLYGGSVKAANAAEIFEVEEVGGVLVGGASLNAEEFTSIIRAASKG